MNDLHAKHADRVAAAHKAHGEETARIQAEVDAALRVEIAKFGQTLTDASQSVAAAYMSASGALKDILDRASEQSASAFTANSLAIAGSAQAMESAMRDRIAYFVAGKLASEETAPAMDEPMAEKAA